VVTFCGNILLPLTIKIQQSFVQAIPIAIFSNSFPEPRTNHRMLDLSPLKNADTTKEIVVTI
jgi:hypothetical protein